MPVIERFQKKRLRNTIDAISTVENLWPNGPLVMKKKLPNHVNVEAMQLAENRNLKKRTKPKKSDNEKQRIERDEVLDKLSVVK